MTNKKLFSILGVCALSAGCSGRPGATATVQPATDRAAAVEMPAAQASAAHAATAAAPAPAAGQDVTGTVLETMNASNYTYVRVKADGRELWAATSQIKVAVGDTIAFPLEQPMENFHSQALNRDFPLIYFVSRIGSPSGASALPLAIGHAPAGQSAAAAASPEPAAATLTLDKKGTTVAAVWKTRASLAGKPVTVHGKVVKYNGGILGVNWIHLQDGTGSAADGSNDITVTSEMETKVGDVITVTGTVALNKDLGSGYNYPVIIERASVAAR